jgi:hypothetical protein
MKVGGLEPDKDTGRPLRDDDFFYMRSGTWRLEGDVLVTETDNTPWIAWFDKTFHDDPKEERDRKRPKPDKQTERKRIVRIDDEKMTFDDGYYLERDRRVK